LKPPHGYGECDGWHIDAEGFVVGCDRCGLDDEDAEWLARAYLGAAPPAPWTLASPLGDFACEVCGVDPIPDFSEEHSNELAEMLGVCLCEPCARRLEGHGGVHRYRSDAVDAAARRRSDESRCSAGCPGWALFQTEGREGGDGVQVQRCDDCGVLSSDGDALTLARGYFQTITGCPIHRGAQSPERATLGRQEMRTA
jgi:hypothetical protein